MQLKMKNFDSLVKMCKVVKSKQQGCKVKISTELKAKIEECELKIEHDKLQYEISQGRGFKTILTN